MPTERNNKTTIGIIIAVVIVVLLGIYFFMTSGKAKIQSFKVANSQFVVKGTGLSKVEIWGVPTGSTGSKTDNMLLTIVQPKEGSESNQELTAHVPLMELGLSDIFAVGYDKDGKNVGRVSLGYSSPAALREALWGKK